MHLIINRKTNSLAASLLGSINTIYTSLLFLKEEKMFADAKRKRTTINKQSLEANTCRETTCHGSVWEQLATDQFYPCLVVPRQVFTPFSRLLISTALVVVSRVGFREVTGVQPKLFLCKILIVTSKIHNVCLRF